MISGTDYKKRTRTRFVIYAVVAGPLMGLGLCLCLLIPFGLFERFFGLEQHREIAFLPVMLAVQWFFPIGTGPALLTALVAMARFIKKQGIEIGDVLVSSAIGAILGNTAAMILVLKFWLGERSDVVSLPVLVFLIALPLVLGPIVSAILWLSRPKQWIGPLTKDELAVWRGEQDAVNQ